VTMLRGARHAHADAMHYPHVATRNGRITLIEAKSRTRNRHRGGVQNPLSQLHAFLSFYPLDVFGVYRKVLLVGNA
jgi:hypothetical protein